MSNYKLANHLAGRYVPWVSVCQTAAPNAAIQPSAMKSTAAGVSIFAVSLIDAPHMCIKEPASVVPHSQSANVIVISGKQVSSLNSTMVSCAAAVGV